MKGFWQLLKDRRGAVTVEFSLTVIVFIFLIFFTAEIARMAYISSVIDYAVSEAAKEGKNAGFLERGGYIARFQTRLTEQGGTLWGFLTRKDAVAMQITYADSVQSMIDSGGSPAHSRYQPLARYYLEYHYHPIFFPFPEMWANNVFKREVIFVQEYERSKFMD